MGVQYYLFKFIFLWNKRKYLIISMISALSYNTCTLGSLSHREIEQRQGEKHKQEDKFTINYVAIRTNFNF